MNYTRSFNYTITSRQAVTEELNLGEYESLPSRCQPSRPVPSTTETVSSTIDRMINSEEINNPTITSTREFESAEISPTAIATQTLPAQMIIFSQMSSLTMVSPTSAVVLSVSSVNRMVTSSDSIIPSSPYVMESLSMDGTRDSVSPAITPPHGIIHPSPTIATTSLRQDTVTSYYGTKMMLVPSIPISASVSGKITPSTYTIMDVTKSAITSISPSPQRTTIEQSPTIPTTTSISATITQTPSISTTPSPTPLTDEHSLDRVLESLFIESDNLIIATTYNLSFILRGVGQNQTVELEISEV